MERSFNYNVLVGSLFSLYSAFGGSYAIAQESNQDNMAEKAVRIIEPVDDVYEIFETTKEIMEAVGAISTDFKELERTADRIREIEKREPTPRAGELREKEVEKAEKLMERIHENCDKLVEGGIDIGGYVADRIPLVNGEKAADFLKDVYIGAKVSLKDYIQNYQGAKTILEKPHSQYRDGRVVNQPDIRGIEPPYDSRYEKGGHSRTGNYRDGDSRDPFDKWTKQNPQEEPKDRFPGGRIPEGG